jgi:hypothetical protein
MTEQSIDPLRQRMIEIQPEYLTAEKLPRA